MTGTVFTAGEVVFTVFYGDYRSIGTQHETWFHLALVECSCTDPPGQDANPSQAPSQQCWYSFAAEYTKADGGE